jgi:type IX secretion system PorP/SprF family membrane protein
MLKYFLLASLFFSGYFAQTQQLQIVSQYDQHRFLHNPAGAGLGGATNIGMTYRSQWSGISGAPVTQMLYGEKYFEKKRIGIAAVLYNDVTGPTKRTGLQYGINYNLPLNQETTKKIIFGMEVRGLQYRIDKAKLNEYIPGDPVLSGGDKLTKGDAGVGVYYASPNLNLGASISQLVQGELRFAQDVLNAKQRAQLYRHYYIMGDYTYTDRETKVIPSFQIVYLPSSPIEFTYGFRLEHKEQFWWGMHLRHKQGWMLNAGYKYKKKLNIGYAYDFYKTPIDLFTPGSGGHEVMLKYSFVK